jgi:hypothetical protein
MDTADPQFAKLIEESAALNDPDVTELIELSQSSVKRGTASSAEVHDLVKQAKQATGASKTITEDHQDISEEEIATLLKQLDDESKREGEIEPEPDAEKKPSVLTNPTQPDDSAEIARILSQLTDAARLEQKFEDSDSESQFPSVSRLSLPSVPKDEDEADNTDDDLSARLANLKSFTPNNYTGTDRGSINIFIPSVAKTEEDETIHWCGMPVYFCF